MKPSNAAGWLMCSALLAAPCTVTSQQAPPQTADVPAPPVQAAVGTELDGKTYTVPAGTKVLLSLKSGVNTKTARPGDGVYLVSTFPVIVGSHVLIPSGVYVQGVVDRVERPGRVKGRAKLLMHFTTMIFPNGQVVGIPGTVDSLPGSGGPSVKGDEGTIEQPGNKGKDAINVAKGGVIGATGGVIGGAAAGNPATAAAIGGLAGVAGGLIYTLLTRGDEVVIPEGTNLEMVMQRPLELQAAQLNGISDAHGNPQYIPTGGQSQPLSKPGHIVCPPGSLGCS
jgi:type IV secretion system protein VirB10